jgi:Uma2 family endonuclease
MATSTPQLTLSEFQRLYANQDKAYDYWFGEVIPKAMPTLRHGITQKTVCSLLDGFGYFTCVEVDLHIHPDWQPRPDGLFVIEILLPDDRWGQVRQKCKNYERLTRIKTIYLLDPDSAEGWFWNTARQDTERIDSLALPCGDRLDLSIIWEQVEQQI